MEIVKLYILDIETAFHHQKVLEAHVNESQKEKAYRYKNEIDQIRSLASSYLMNSLSNKSLQISDTGKPYSLMFLILVNISSWRSLKMKSV